MEQVKWWIQLQHRLTYIIGMIVGRLTVERLQVAPIDLLFRHSASPTCYTTHGQTAAINNRQPRNVIAFVQIDID